MTIRASGLFYALLAGAAFLAGLLILVLLLFNARLLVELGLAGKLYYLVLVPLGLAAAAFLFGILKSYASYKGKVLGGALELGGPVIAFLLVLILGFWLVPDPSGFSVTLYVTVGEGSSAEPLSRGKIMLRLRGDPRTESISPQGTAHFNGIPATLRGQKVGVQLLDASGYETTQKEITLDREDLSLVVHPKTAEFVGYVRTDVRAPIRSARVSVAGQGVSTDDNGYFKLTITDMKPEQSATLQVSAPGFGPKSYQVTRGGAEIIVLLSRTE